MHRATFCLRAFSSAFAVFAFNFATVLYTEEIHLVPNSSSMCGRALVFGAYFLGIGFPRNLSQKIDHLNTLKASLSWYVVATSLFEPFSILFLVLLLFLFFWHSFNFNDCIHARGTAAAIDPWCICCLVLFAPPVYFSAGHIAFLGNSVALQVVSCILNHHQKWIFSSCVVYQCPRSERASEQREIAIGCAQRRMALLQK